MSQDSQKKTNAGWGRVRSVRKKGRNARFTSDPSIKRFVDLIGEETKKSLKTVAKNLMEPGKGILALEDTAEQLGARLERYGLTNDQSTRVDYVVSLLGDSHEWRMLVSGVLLRDSIFAWLRHKDVRKKALKGLEDHRIYIGIKKDNKVTLPGSHGEQTFTGLDILPDDCLKWKGLNVSFAMISCTFDLSEYTPSLLAYRANTTVLARSASICQKAGLVPILSLHVVRRPLGATAKYELNDLDPLKITEGILASVIKALSDHHVYLEGTLIRLSPVFPADPAVKAVAKETLKAIIHRIPPALGGVLLMECQNLSFSTGVLNEMALTLCPKPCNFTFAWGEIVKSGMTAVWKGREENKRDVAMAMADRLKAKMLSVLYYCVVLLCILGLIKMMLDIYDVIRAVATAGVRVGGLVSGYIQGAGNAGVATTVKEYTVDISKFEKPRLYHDRSRKENDKEEDDLMHPYSGGVLGHRASPTVREVLDDDRLVVDGVGRCGIRAHEDDDDSRENSHSDEPPRFSSVFDVDEAFVAPAGKMATLGNTAVGDVAVGDGTNTGNAASKVVADGGGRVIITSSLLLQQSSTCRGCGGDDDVKNRAELVSPDAYVTGDVDDNGFDNEVDDCYGEHDKDFVRSILNDDSSDEEDNEANEDDDVARKALSSDNQDDVDVDVDDGDDGDYYANNDTITCIRSMIRHSDGDFETDTLKYSGLDDNSTLDTSFGIGEDWAQEESVFIDDILAAPPPPRKEADDNVAGASMGVQKKDTEIPSATKIDIRSTVFSSSVDGGEKIIEAPIGLRNSSSKRIAPTDTTLMSHNASLVNSGGYNAYNSSLAKPDGLLDARKSSFKGKMATDSPDGGVLKRGAGIGGLVVFGLGGGGAAAASVEDNDDDNDDDVSDHGGAAGPIHDDSVGDDDGDQNKGMDDDDDVYVNRGFNDFVADGDNSEYDHAGDDGDDEFEDANEDNNDGIGDNDDDEEEDEDDDEYETAGIGFTATTDYARSTITITMDNSDSGGSVTREFQIETSESTGAVSVRDLGRPGNDEDVDDDEVVAAATLIARAVVMRESNDCGDTDGCVFELNKSAQDEL